MKKTILFSSALVALAMLASCQKEEFIETPSTSGVTEFTATIEQTKTAIASDGKVTWTAGDEITVTDAASKSAVYVAASSGSSTKFNLKDGQTAVGSGPYTATYGDITKQKYSAVGANCPLTAETADASTKNLQFSSPYAVLKITATSSGSDVIKKVVASYGNSSSVLDCGEGVTLTSTGNDFFLAVQPATEANLSVTFFTADKMAQKTRKSAVSLAAKDLLPVTFSMTDWAVPTFKAVYDTNGEANTLTFYYDAVDHSSEGTTYNNLPTAATLPASWGYNSNRSNIKNVKIDASVAGYSGLTSTAYMFQGMTAATTITGAEYLDVSNVTDMSFMFYNFGSGTKNLHSTLNSVPDASNWNTSNVTNMQAMFGFYGNFSDDLTKVPDVSNWNTSNVTNMSNMFQKYGYSSTTLSTVPDVSKWNTGNVKSMNLMFSAYGSASTVLNAVPDVSGWKTDNVTDMSGMFKEYGNKSTALNVVPDVSGWNTGNVTSMADMFNQYGYSSPALTKVPDVSGWSTAKLTNLSNMFKDYGGLKAGSTTVESNVEFTLDLSGWDLTKLEKDRGNSLFDLKPKTFNVKIPAKTGEKANETDKWYYGDGTGYITPPSGTTFTPFLAGVFSISATKKVLFSKGNLVATINDSGAPTAWKFATNQYDYIGEDGANKTIGGAAGDVDLFGWSTASTTYGISTSTSDSSYSGDFKEWGENIGDGNTWRTLTREEWCYLFAYDPSTSQFIEDHPRRQLFKTGVTVCGNADCIVLLPDGWVWNEATVGTGWLGEYNETTTDVKWSTMEAAGAVCLPAAGRRLGSGVYNFGGHGYYWSSSVYDGTRAYRVCFYSDDVYPGDFEYRKYGYSVRLITDVK